MGAGPSDESLSSLGELELLGLWVQVMKALKQRGLVRSAGSTPLGGYAETLVARRYGTDVLQGQDDGYDVVDPATKSRLQVKARRYVAGASTTHFGEFDLFDQRRFDEFVGVVFNEDFTVRTAWRMPWTTVDLLAATVRGKRRLYIRSVLLASAEDASITEIQLDQGPHTS